MARADRLRRADHDGAWKRVLGELLRECIAFTLPDLHDAIDWSRKPVSLEQELRPILRQAALKQRVADLVTQVWLRSGEATWLLIHAEVQGKEEPDFAERMYTYAALLHLNYRGRANRRPVRGKAPLDPPQGFVGIALLTDADPSWHPGPYRWGWGDFGIDYRYHTLKLADWQARSAELASDDRAFAWVVRTWLAVQAAESTTDAQGDARRRMGRALLAARRSGQLRAEQAAAVYIFLDAVNRLPDALAETIDREVQITEEAPMAELLTRWERRGMREGLKQGREEGMAVGMSVALLRMLAGKRIPLDADTEARIRSLDSETLLSLADALLGFRDRADLDAWLAQTTTQTHP